VEGKRRIRITIHSALIFEVGNFGDELLRNLLEQSIRNVLPDVEISYISLDNFKNDVVNAIKNSDIFIYCPGGYLGYIEKWLSGTAKKTWERFTYYYLPGFLFTLSKKKLVLFGQGIGPYEYFFLRPVLGKIGKGSSLITVRDLESKRLLMKCGVPDKKICLTADCSQVLRKKRMIKETRYSRTITERFPDKKKIFILYFNDCSWHPKISMALEKFKADERYSFIIGGDSYVARSSRNMHYFTFQFPRERTYTYIYQNPSQLLSIINECDVVLTPKLHTSIIGCVLEKSVLAFSVQYAKTSLYFKAIGYPDRVYNLFDMDAYTMAQIIDKYIDTKVVIPREILEKSQKNYDMLERYLERFQKKRKKES